jgi:archaellum biogenesis ATPase FlaH
LTDKFKFDEAFEDSLIARMIKNKRFFAAYSCLIRSELFENEAKQGLYSIVEDYYKKYEDQITIEIIRNEINELSNAAKGKKESDRQTIRDYYNEKLNHIVSINVEGGEDYTIDKIVDFVKQKEFHLLLVENKEQIQSDKINIGDFQQKLSDIDCLGSTLDLGYDYFDDTVYRTSHAEDSKISVVSTGFKQLDHYLGGGLGLGEMGLLIGQQGRGKTAMLINIAVGALIHRKNVIYFGFEGACRDVATRFDMRLSRKDKDKLIKESDQVTHFVSYFASRFKSKLIIKMYPTEGATVRDLDNFLTYIEMVKGFKADLLIIDYLNIAKQAKAKNEIWEGRTYIDGKNLASKRNLPLWSAVQAKVGTLKENIVTPKDIAECTGRAWAISDVIIGLCQSDAEYAMTPPEMRWYVGKLRNRGEARNYVNVYFKKDIMMFEEGTSKLQGLSL